MRSLFIIVSLLSVMFIGCVASKPAFHSEIPSDYVYIDPDNSWSNQCPTGQILHGVCDSPVRSITVRVVNRKYRDANVTVRCMYLPENVLFGEQTSVVKKRNDATFLIWGMSRSVWFSNSIRCQIVDVR
jgi:hypothetical protein